MKIKDLRHKIRDIEDDVEVVVFRDGESIHPDISDVVFIDDKDLYDNPVLEIGCGWK